jgi:hypothetical protein
MRAKAFFGGMTTCGRCGILRHTLLTLLTNYECSTPVHLKPYLGTLMTICSWLCGLLFLTHSHFLNSPKIIIISSNPDFDIISIILTSY